MCCELLYKKTHFIQGEQDGLSDASALEQAAPQREDDVPAEAFEGPAEAALQVEGLLPKWDPGDPDRIPEGPQWDPSLGHQKQTATESAEASTAAATGSADSSSASCFSKYLHQRGEAGKCSDFQLKTILQAFKLYCSIA